jgi:AAA+ ATPase superfamily predicted ATPase
MAVEIYRWAARSQFRDRAKALETLEQWWNSPSLEPISLYGRRRVGKSWLFRRFAHGRPAVILVADRVAAGQQLTHLAAQLAGSLDVRPQLDSVADLFTVLYDMASRRKILVVIDEFPYLLGTTAAEQQRTLSSIQAVMERKRDESKLKLVLTGSTISQMEDLQAEKNPLHGRLAPLPLWPMTFAEATTMLKGLDTVDQMTRYAIAGGMPRYLEAFGKGDLPQALACNVVDPHSQLFNEPRSLLNSELREPAVYFSILAELARKPQDVAAVAAALRMETKELSRYLTTLESLRLVARRHPVGAAATARGAQWTCIDYFVRFWFRFVQPFQSELEAGSDPTAHVTRNILPHLADHAALAFEEAVVSWVRRRAAGATAVGVWWGPSLHHLRASKERFTEEIDAVALQGGNVSIAAEAKWTTKPLAAKVLSDLLDYKLPALTQAGVSTSATELVLVSKSGFTTGLRKLADETPRVILKEASEILHDLKSR